MMGSVPTFSNVNTWVTGSPCGILPKSWVSLSNLNSALLFCCASAVVQTKATNATHIVAIFFIIVFLLVFVLAWVSLYRDKQIYYFKMEWSKNVPKNLQITPSFLLALDGFKERFTVHRITEYLSIYESAGRFPTLGFASHS